MYDDQGERQLAQAIDAAFHDEVMECFHQLALSMRRGEEAPANTFAVELRRLQEARTLALETALGREVEG